MHLKVSQNNFCPDCICIVHDVAMTSHENRSFILQLFKFFLKIDHEVFNSSKLVNFYLKVAQILLILKHNFYREGVPEF